MWSFQGRVVEARQFEKFTIESNKFKNYNFGNNVSFFVCVCAGATAFQEFKVLDKGPTDSSAACKVKINNVNCCCGGWMGWRVYRSECVPVYAKRSTKSILLLMHCITSNTPRILNTFYAMFTHSFVAIYMLHTIHVHAHVHEISRKRVMYLCIHIDIFVRNLL